MRRSSLAAVVLLAVAALSCAQSRPAPAPRAVEPVVAAPTVPARPAEPIAPAVKMPPEADPACDSCHGFPPDVGAHRAHHGWSEGARWGAYGEMGTLENFVAYGAPPDRYYAFGCGNCHPTDPASHMDGAVQVVVSGKGAPAGSLKALSAAGAAYDPKTGTCSGVYCHSSGQQADAGRSLPVYVRTPGFRSGQKVGCTSCHANPPRYASAGPGTPGANSHVGLAFDGAVWGHFLGLPGPHHPGGSKHGGAARRPPQDASPITCQTCHAGTVDPSNTGPSGFYYLDTSGDYSVPRQEVALGCGPCHGAGDARAPRGTGRVRPLLHVNGKRDVVFDAREALPPLDWLPPNPFTPTRPNWSTNGPVGYVLPGVVLQPPRMPPAQAGARPDGVPAFTQPTFSFDLGAARYASATKTCTSVACHLSQVSVQWGGAPRPGMEGCNGCHGM